MHWVDMNTHSAVLVLVVFHFIQDWVVGTADSAETPRHPSPQTPPPAPPGGTQDISRPAKRHNPYTCPVASSQWNVPAWNTARERRPGGIWYKCPSHLNWLLSMWRSSGSTPSPSRMAELLSRFV
ncbi:hypothetical protein CHARACLAT_019195 [Characodon lateralis]|uniref:Secreted protein n=1 Tax=Characodon lateralis TaxID=208331 RepID=A0ABU7D876_9TELE|nr:hypothetical protein [Characodon lateralis]